MSDVLYQRGDGFEAALWDDSELLAAWNRQTSSNAPDLADARARLDTARSTGADAESASSRASAEVMPPMPPGIDEPTQKMLRAWFLAGYWTGVAAAKQTSP